MKHQKPEITEILRCSCSAQIQITAPIYPRQSASTHPTPSKAPPAARRGAAQSGHSPAEAPGEDATHGTRKKPGKVAKM